MDRVHLTIINNPFDPIQDREQRSFLYEPIPIGSYIKKANIAIFPDEELNIVYGGRPLTPEEINSIIPMPGDRFVAIPMVAGGGSGDDTRKQILSVVAMVALMYVGGAGGAAIFGEGTTGAAVFAAGVQMVGGYFINSYMQRRMKQDDQQDDKTYGWEITTSMNPGGAIPETCGTVRTGGTCIGYHVTTDGDKQYANILLDGGIGPLDINSTGQIVGLDPKSIEIDGNPISNFDGVMIDVRAGVNNQTPIPFFNDTFTTTAVGDELKLQDDYIYHTTDGECGGLELGFTFPKGLYYTTDEGKAGAAVVTLEAQYRLAGTTEWHGVTSSQGQRYNIYKVINNQIYMIGSSTGKFVPGQTIKLLYAGGEILASIISTENKLLDFWKVLFGDVITVNVTVPETLYAIESVNTSALSIIKASTATFTHMVRFDSLPFGVQEIRCRCISKGAHSIMFTTEADIPTTYYAQVYWTSVTSIVYDDFCYPNHILLGIRALASDKLSGSIRNVTWIQSVSKCWVFNPNTQAYEQKDKTNPAWRCYDIYHQAQGLMNINTGQYEIVVRGEAAHKINYSQFERWANFCDAYGLKCDYIHDKTVTRSEALAPIHLIGRGRTFQSGTQIYCDFDQPVLEPVQIFTPADVCKGGITYEYINTRDRANAIEIKFRDAARDYDWHIFPLYTEEYESDTGVQNPTQITLDACTNYTEAYLNGMYQLKVNKRLLRSATWTAEQKSLACIVGDVVGLQNELPRWGTGGRIVEVGENWVKIDKAVTFDYGKNYIISYQLSNDALDERSTEAHLDTITVERMVMLPGISARPQRMVLYDYAESTDTLYFDTPFNEDTESAIKIDGTHFAVDGDKTVTYYNGLSPVLEFGYGETNVTPVISSVYDSTTDKTTVEIAGFVPDSLATVRFAFTKPRPSDIYAFGEPKKMYKLFKITSISLDGDQRRKITALEHIPEVYVDGTDAPPEIDYDNSQSQQTITVIANENVDKLSGKVYLNISWTPTRQYDGALVLVDGKNVYTAKMSETSYTMEAISLKEYEITIKPIDLFGNPETQSTIKYTVKYDAPPVPPTMITTQPFNGGYICIV